MKQLEMGNIILKLHSVVGIITNSSSEIFTVADEETINAIKEIINSILRINETDPYDSKTADDLFEFSLVKNIPWKDYYEDNADEETINELPYNMYVKVTPKVKGLENTAKILSGLTDLFEIYESCSG